MLHFSSRREWFWNTFYLKTTKKFWVMVKKKIRKRSIDHCILGYNNTM